MASTKKKAFPTFCFLHCAFSPSTFLTPYGSQLTPVQEQNPFKFITRTGLFFPHQRHFYPLATLQTTYKIQAALGLFFRNNFSMLESFHAGVFVLLTTRYCPTSTLLSSDLVLKSTLWVFSPVRLLIYTVWYCRHFHEKTPYGTCFNKPSPVRAL